MSEIRIQMSNLTEDYLRIMEDVRSSDLVIYIVPNYCGIPSANFFVFNERSTGFFQMDRSIMQKYREIKKQFIIVSNTESELFVQPMRQHTNGKPDILYMKTGKYGKKSIAGDILNSETAKDDLERFMKRSVL